MCVIVTYYCHTCNGFIDAKFYNLCGPVLDVCERPEKMTFYHRNCLSCIAIEAAAKTLENMQLNCNKVLKQGRK